MVIYSDELFENINKCINYYKENDNIMILQNFIYIMIDLIKLINKSYFILSEELINYYLSEAKSIWEKGGSVEELNKLYNEYEKKLTEIKSIDEIKSINMDEIKFKEYRVWGFMTTVLTNFRNVQLFYITTVDRTNISLKSACATIGAFFYDLQGLDINEEEIIILLKKYFNEILLY